MQIINKDSITLNNPEILLKYKLKEVSQRERETLIISHYSK